MDSLSKSESAFLEDLARIKSAWVGTASLSILDEGSDLIWSDQPDAWRRLREALNTRERRECFQKCVAELLGGALHSVLVGLDGGTALAEVTTLRVTDEDGFQFRRYLHEYWPEFNEDAT